MATVLSAEQIQTYWHAIAQDRQLHCWHRCYVMTDFTGQARQPSVSPATAAEAAEALDPWLESCQTRAEQSKHTALPQAKKQPTSPVEWRAS